MISEIRIQNFKSIQDLTLKPGRVTVLIGANGSGKSNILEAIAFAAGAGAGKLDNEFLFNRGIRVTEDTWMRSAFPDEQIDEGLLEFEAPIRLTLKGGTVTYFECAVHAEKSLADGGFVGWQVRSQASPAEVDEGLKDETILAGARKILDDRAKDTSLIKHPPSVTSDEWKDLVTRLYASFTISQFKTVSLGTIAESLGLIDFIIYAPENTVLRTPPPEGAISPLGAKGEGLFRLLQSFTDPKIDQELTARFDDLKNRLHLFGWFEDMLAPNDVATAQARLQLRDRWLTEDRAIFDQRSANEGFLYVLFYFTLMMSWRTPKFFAIDNLDNALNPKLCAVLMQQITELAKTYGKQVICTVHNPAILDGLDLTQDDQRLFAVRRNAEGHTTVRRVHAPQPQPGETPVRLSEAFTRGIIGGLPNNF